MSSSVIFENVAKKYKLYRKTSDKLLDIALPKDYGKDFYALQNISFTVEKGDVVGIIGINGSGKSTLSNLIAGVIPASSGKITINGEVALISIGSGLNNNLTGRENIELKCLMLGFSKQEIQDMTPEIIDFAELGTFIDQPVKSYSSGMKSRLGFAISVTIDPDILVIDEALSVGDKTFANKSLAKMNEFKERGKTIFFISHSSGQVKEFCQKALWLEAGEIKAFGSAEEVIPKYEKFVNDFRKLSKEEQEAIKKEFDKRRSTIRVLEEPKEEITPTPSTPKPKEKKNKMKYWILGLLFFSILTVGAVISWEKLFFAKQTEPPEKIEPEVIVENEEAKINTETVEEEAEVIEKLDIRYVNVTAAYVRDIPNIEESNQVSMVYFGQPLLVVDIKEDPNGEIVWLKFNIQDDQAVWISDGVVSKVEEPVNEEELIDTLHQQFHVNLSDVNVLFTTDEESLQEEESRTFTFDQEGYLTEVSYQLGTPASIDEMVTAFGEPQLINEEANMIIYHGENFDFVFSATNSTQLNTLVVQPVINDKEVIVELDLFEEEAESEEAEMAQHEDQSTSNNDTETVTTPAPPKKQESKEKESVKPTTPKKPEKPKTEEPKQPTKPEKPKNEEPEKPTDPTPDPVVPPEDPGEPEDPTPDPITPSDP